MPATSLWRFGNTGKRWRFVRDEVWRWLYKLPAVHCDFTVRLEQYRPGLVLNGCTAELWPAVTRTLRLLKFKSMVVKTDHPSSWWKGKEAEKI
jgi:hypothetical protein